VIWAERSLATITYPNQVTGNFWLNVLRLN
jgi:hypothetical protein